MNGFLILIVDIVILSIIVTSYFLRRHTLDRKTPAIHPRGAARFLISRLLCRSPAEQSKGQSDLLQITKRSLGVG